MAKFLKVIFIIIFLVSYAWLAYYYVTTSADFKTWVLSVLDQKRPQQPDTKGLKPGLNVTNRSVSQYVYSDTVSRAVADYLEQIDKYLAEFNEYYKDRVDGETYTNATAYLSRNKTPVVSAFKEKVRNNTDKEKEKDLVADFEENAARIFEEFEKNYQK